MKRDPLLDAVGRRLRALRQRRGGTLAEISEETGISVSTLSRLESGGRARSSQPARVSATGVRVAGQPELRQRCRSCRPIPE
jgi:hypothetical protein